MKLSFGEIRFNDLNLVVPHPSLFSLVNETFADDHASTELAVARSTQNSEFQVTPKRELVRLLS